MKFCQSPYFCNLVTVHNYQSGSLGFHLTSKMCTAKGQLISKQNCRAITSPKKRT